MSDLISRSALLKEVKSLTVTVMGLRAGKGILHKYAKQYKDTLLRIINEQPTIEVTPVVYGKWIPFTLREADAEEKEAFGCNKMLDCRLPEEDEEIFVTHKYKGKLYVRTDIFIRDGSECYLECGGDFGEDVIAWMPFPQPYQPEGEKE